MPFGSSESEPFQALLEVLSVRSFRREVFGEKFSVVLIERFSAVPSERFLASDSQ